PAARDDVAEGERKAFDGFVNERGARPSSGPYSLLLHMPELAQKLESFRLSVRGEASVPQPIQEIVMLTVAREMDCGYIWYAHAAAASEAGVRRDIIDGIREKKALTGLGAAEQAAVDFARELLRSRKVSATTFEKATASFGRRGTMTLTN